MRNNVKRFTIALLAFAMLICPIGCSRGAKKGEVATVPKDDFKPVVDTGKDSDLYDRYVEYKENASLAFSGFGETDPSAFDYETGDDGIVITKYIGTDEIVIVPGYIEGAPVVEIGEGAFQGSSLRAVYIPDTVKIINKGSFIECDGLSTLRVPFMGDGQENSFLGYIFGADIPDKNVVTVPPSLDMLILGDNTEKISENALRGCKTLSAVILPDSVTEISRLAFYECADLVYVSLGDGVGKIGEYCFAYCSSLYHIDCSNVDDIEDGAFFYCNSLNGIELKMKEDDYFGRIFGANDPEYNDEFVPRSVRNVIIAEGTLSIGHFAFASCRYLTSVKFPDSLESIGVRAFYACRSLESVVIPDGVKKIDDDAFFGCDAMVSVTFGKSLESLGMQAFMGCEMLRAIALPDSLKEIKPATFYDCKALVDISLGGVKIIGKDAFKNCDSAKSVPLDGITVAEGNDTLR